MTTALSLSFRISSRNGAQFSNKSIAKDCDTPRLQTQITHRFFVVDLFTLHMNTAMRQGQITPLGPVLSYQEAFMTFINTCIGMFKKNPSKIYFCRFFFHHFMHLYCPGAGADNPHGENYQHNWRLLLL